MRVFCWFPLIRLSFNLICYTNCSCLSKIYQLEKLTVHQGPALTSNPLDYGHSAISSPPKPSIFTRTWQPCPVRRCATRGRNDKSCCKASEAPPRAQAYRSPFHCPCGKSVTLQSKEKSGVYIYIYIKIWYMILKESNNRNTEHESIQCIHTGVHIYIVCISKLVCCTFTSCVT